MSLEEIQKYFAQFNIHVSIARGGFYRVMHDGNIWHYARSLEETFEVCETLAMTNA